MSTALVLFRRDLRLADNTALIEAAGNHDQVIPLFILDEALLDKWQDASFRLNFMAHSVRDLSEQIEAQGGVLYVCQGRYGVQLKQALTDIREAVEVEHIYLNRDYSPTALRRDDGIRQLGAGLGINVTVCDDSMLNPPEAVFKADGKPYTVFTPYFRKAATIAVAPPAELENINFLRCNLPSYGESNVSALMGGPETVQAGRTGALELMQRIAQLKYDDYRDVPAAAQTTQLAAHLRFGTCSPREVYAAAREGQGTDSGLARQLYWRDFYTQISAHFPHVYRGAFRRQYDRVEWDENTAGFERWKAGETGFPIVDAGMRELKETGIMHNRVRMIVASFLTKNLHINWRLGEAHFANLLIDYDPAANNGNWQWCASTGCDAQPYFRVFNPWRQQAKFDPECHYIKRWVPELAPYPAKVIHKLEKEGDFYLDQIVDLKTSAEESKRRFKLASQSA